MSINALRSRVLFSLLAPFALAAASRAEVLVVDAAGGGQYLQISAAVAAASNGDTLLVKTGTYSAFTIDGKSLSVVADGGANVVVDGSMGIKNLTAAQTVVLSGLASSHASVSSNSSDPTFGAGLFVTACQGQVRAQACQFEGRFGQNAGCFSNPSAGRTGVYLASSPNVALEACTLLGGNGGGHGGQCWCGTDGREGGRGLFTQDSRAALYDCHLTGGNGGRGAEVGGFGGDAAFLQGTLGMFASHSFFQGGSGGTADAASNDPGGLCLIGTGGDGGNGLRSNGPSTAAQIVGGSFMGGAGGIPLFGGPHGNAGFNQVGSNIFTFEGPPRVFLAPAIARENTTVALTFFGQPGDEVYLRIARQTGYREKPLYHGVLLTKNLHPEYIAIVGTIPASGVLDSSFTLPDLGPGGEAQSFFLQGQFKNTAGATWLGSFAALTEIDSSF